MKNIITAILFVTVLAYTTSAADSRYIEAMKKNIESIYKAKTLDEYQQVVNAFERIGAAEKTQWEPCYYAAYGYTIMATMEKEAAKKDAYLDQATVALDKAKAIVPQESEVVAMEGFIHMIRLTVDPGTRGQQYSGLAMQAFGKAVGLNPENPRALTLMAQMQYGTAQFFKTSTAEPCAMTQKALEKFETYKSENPLAPQWGRGQAEKMKAQCEGQR